MKLKHFRIIFSSVIFILFLIAVFISSSFAVKILNFLTVFQLIPALFQIMLHGLLSGAVGLLFIAALTFIFGRVYCSFLCPLGIYQDIIIRAGKFFKMKFKYIKPLKIVNYGILAALIASAVLMNILIIHFDPYSIFMRALSDIIKPFVFLVINKTVNMLSKTGIYFSVYNKDFKQDAFYFIVTAASILAVTALAFIKGRLYCNLICPAGTLLGIFSKHSFFKIGINKEECISCGKCERTCKGGCIDAKNKTVDNSRCVSCFNCVPSCPYSVINYKAGISMIVNDSKRKMLKQSLPLVLGLSIIPSMLIKSRSAGHIIMNSKNIIIPPGAVNTVNYVNSCTSCHLCITKCPSKVIRPVFSDKDKKVFQPALDFDHSYCDYECNICSQVCPSGAIKPVSLENKKTIQIGEITLNKNHCIAYSQNKDCGACSEHCPTKAVYMIPYNDIYAPITNTSICIGCGACEFVCPARPVKAIKIRSNPVHKKAQKPETGADETIKDQQNKKIKDSDFPF